jgi:DNA repair exonuclease SbcCD ATPase subunit
MRLTEVLLQDWMCFAGSNKLEGLPAAPIAVIARFSDNRERSNWAGKTALLEAIRWALQGVHRKRVEDGIIFRGAPKAGVVLRFDTGLQVSRVRPRGGPTVLEIVGAGRPLLTRDAAEAELERILRLSSEDMRNTLWWGQGDTEALIGETSGDRRKVVGRWLELELWERLGKRATKELGTFRDALERARAVLTGLDSGRPVADVERDLAIVEAKLRRADENIKAVEISLAGNPARDRKAAEVSKMETELQEAARRASAARQDYAMASGATVPAEELDARREASRAAGAKRGAAEGEERRALAVVGDGFDGECPVTCEACPVAEEVREKDAAIQARAQAAKVVHAKAAKESEEAFRRMEAAVNAQNQAEKSHVRMDEAIGATRAISVRLDAARAELAEMPVPEPEDPGARARLSTLRTERDGEQIRVGALRREAQEARRRDDGIEQARANVAVAEGNARAAVLAARALGPTGIPAKIAADQLGALERRANALLSGMGLSFAFAWQRELQDQATECRECGHIYEKRSRAKECPSCGIDRGRKRSDELDVIVDDGSEELEDARVKSGGARVLVASAIRLAAAMMIRERRGSPLALAIVDEPFGALDAANRRELARTFGAMLGSVGLEQAFVVSHDEALLAALPARIVVTRDGRASRATLEA